MPFRGKRAKRFAAHMHSICCDSDGAAAPAKSRDAAVKQPKPQRQQGGEDGWTREVMPEMPALCRFSEEHARGPDVDPVDAVSMAVVLWQSRCPEAPDDRDHQHDA